MFQIATILHPTDFSPLAEHAFHLAYSLARDHGGRLIVLHVAEPAGDAASMTAPAEEDFKAVAELLHHLEGPEAKVPVEYRLEEGNPAVEIVRFAEEAKCDMIVMGTHGRTGVARLLMGSVAEHVVRKATCPVLVVKTPLSESPSA